MCLGHQVICELYGGRVDRAARIVHGKPDEVTHDGSALYEGLPSPFEAGRYHSLAALAPIPEELVVTAHTPDGEVMGVRHQTEPTHGVQFHPESVLTPHGRRLIENFLAMGGRPVITSAIKQLVEGRDLSGEEAHVAMMQVMSGDASPAQIAAFLVALRMKGETPDEIAGCARAMRAHVTPATPSHSDLVDTCGTGGDGSDTFNISTSAALVAAAAGAVIAKHGNRAVSSRCGSADVLEALGVRIDLAPTDVAACIDEVGFGFLFAQAHHPGHAPRRPDPARARHPQRLQPARAARRIPAGARRQVVGVYSEALVVPIAQVLSKLGTEHALVVHGAGGLDELTPTGENLMAEVRNGSVSTSTLDPAPLSTGPVPGRRTICAAAATPPRTRRSSSRCSTASAGRGATRSS